VANIEVTGELIKGSVARRIIEVIPEAAGRVYKEGQNQNVSGAAFYIVQRRINQNEQIKAIISREYEMIIRYEPDINSQTQLESCALIGTILLDALRTIDPGNNVVIRGDDMSFQIVDNVGLIYVTYPIRIKFEPDTLNPMENLEIIKEVSE
jgi:hypothetical protein